MRYKDEGKPKLTLINPHFLEAMAILQEEGDKKHQEHHWLLGVPVNEILNAMKRHIHEIEKGERYDGDTVHQHATAVALGAMYIFHYTRNYEEYEEFFTLLYDRSTEFGGPVVGSFIPDEDVSGRIDKVPGGSSGDIQEPLVRRGRRFDDIIARPRVPFTDRLGESSSGQDAD